MPIGYSDGSYYEDPIHDSMAKLFPEDVKYINTPIDSGANAAVSNPKPTARARQGLPADFFPPNTDTVLDTAKAQYPALRNQDIGFTETPKDNEGYLEFWPKGEPGTPDRPRPEELSADKPGLQVFRKDTRPIDILGDVVSHHLVNEDPVIKQHYEDFQKSLTPEQNKTLEGQYQHAKDNNGETRSFEDWKTTSGIPAFFRGYAFDQWPKDFTDKNYTPEQRQKFDSMMEYLKTEQPSNANKDKGQGGQDPNLSFGEKVKAAIQERDTKGAAWAEEHPVISGVLDALGTSLMLIPAGRATPLQGAKIPSPGPSPTARLPAIERLNQGLFKPQELDPTSTGSPQANTIITGKSGVKFTKPAGEPGDLLDLKTGELIAPENQLPQPANTNPAKMPSGQIDNPAMDAAIDASWAKFGKQMENNLPTQPMTSERESQYRIINPKAFDKVKNFELQMDYKYKKTNQDWVHELTPTEIETYAKLYKEAGAPDPHRRDFRIVDNPSQQAMDSLFSNKPYDPVNNARDNSVDAIFKIGKQLESMGMTLPKDGESAHVEDRTNRPEIINFLKKLPGQTRAVLGGLGLMPYSEEELFGEGSHANTANTKSGDLADKLGIRNLDIVQAANLGEEDFNTWRTNKSAEIAVQRAKTADLIKSLDEQLAEIDKTIAQRKKRK